MFEVSYWNLKCFGEIFLLLYFISVNNTSILTEIAPNLNNKQHKLRAFKLFIAKFMITDFWFTN